MATQPPSLKRETKGLKLLPLFTIFGWILIGFSILISILVLAPIAASYWGGNAKAARDAAKAGSLLLSQLSILARWPKILPPLIFLGVASFMLGIAMEFAAIPGLLDRRTKLLVQAIPVMGKSKK
jgi:hypothetical protein